MLHNPQICGSAGNVILLKWWKPMRLNGFQYEPVIKEATNA